MTEVTRKLQCRMRWAVLFPVVLLAAVGSARAETQSTAGGPAHEPRTAEALYLRLGHVGLDPARVAVTFTMADGKTHTIEINEMTAYRGSWYVTKLR